MTASSDQVASDSVGGSEINDKTAVQALIFLLITFILGTLCLQGFNLVFQQVGKDVGAVQQASLITALPSIVLGIVCFIYGSLGDFISLKRLVILGLVVLFAGSMFGFVANFFFAANLWTVIIARVLQTAGEQVAGSVYLVITTKYLKPSLRAIFLGLYAAGYQISAAIGVFAAGILTSIAWQYLFLIPAVTIFFIPILLRNLPNNGGNGTKVDWPGFTVFGLATAFLTLFFSYSQWWLLIVAALLFAGFAFYISKASNPFVTPAFFKNTRWLMAISLILIFYFNNYCMSPIYNAICRDIYGITSSASVSMHIVWAFLVAAIFGTTSGAIVDRIGRQPTFIIAACMMIGGFAGSALVISAGIIPLTITAALFYGGVGLIYSPVVSTVLDTLPTEQSGRGVGMNDLVMNVTGSIGIAIFGGLMADDSLGSISPIGAIGKQAVYSNLLLIAACVALLGLIVFLVFRKRIYAKGQEN